MLATMATLSQRRYGRIIGSVNAAAHLKENAGARRAGRRAEMES